MLEGLDLKALGWNSVRYLHTISEAMNLAFADREACVGDPKFIDVPIKELLSAEYAAKQRARLDAGKAFGRMPDPGLGGRSSERNPPEVKSLLRPIRSIARSPQIRQCLLRDAVRHDVRHADGGGPGLRAVCGGAREAAGTGASVVRGAGQTPRLTPSPALALRDGEFAIALGTPGGDVQCGSMLEVFLNADRVGPEPAAGD